MGKTRYPRVMDPYIKSSHLKQVPEEFWPEPREGAARPIEVWLSGRFLAQVYEDQGHLRVSVNRIKPVGGSWAEGITWDELMRVKREIGRGDAWCVEVFPPDESVVNVANLRHLWVLPEAPAYGWNKAGGDQC